MTILIEEASTVTRKGQTTVPKAVRDALGVKTGDRIVYSVDSKGGVSMARSDSGVSDEAAVDAFLAFISNDIKRRPEAILPFDPVDVARRAKLLEGVEVDLDGDFSGAIPI